MIYLRFVMADVHSKETRSYNMSKIKSKDTKPEVIVRKFLFKNGFRYRLHKKDIAGKPDIYISSLKCIININGCFWHGHENCRYYKLPKTNSLWWEEKISRNISRDLKNFEINKSLGYHIITIWECNIKKQENSAVFLNDLLNELINLKKERTLSNS